MFVIIGPAKEDLEFLWKFQVSKSNFIVAESQDTATSGLRNGQ